MKKIIIILIALFLIAGVSAGVSLINWGDTTKIEEVKAGTLSINYIDDDGEPTGISSLDFSAGVLNDLMKKDAEILELQTENNKIKDCAKSSNDFAEYQTCVGLI